MSDKRVWTVQGKGNAIYMMFIKNLNPARFEALNIVLMKRSQFALYSKLIFGIPLNNTYMQHTVCYHTTTIKWYMSILSSYLWFVYNMLRVGIIEWYIIHWLDVESSTRHVCESNGSPRAASTLWFANLLDILHMYIQVSDACKQSLAILLVFWRYSSPFYESFFDRL